MAAAEVAGAVGAEALAPDHPRRAVQAARLADRHVHVRRRLVGQHDPQRAVGGEGVPRGLGPADAPAGEGVGRAAVVDHLAAGVAAVVEAQVVRRVGEHAPQRAGAPRLEPRRGVVAVDGPPPRLGHDDGRRQRGLHRGVTVARRRSGVDLPRRRQPRAVEDFIIAAAGQLRQPPLDAGVLAPRLGDGQADVGLVDEARPRRAGQGQETLPHRLRRGARGQQSQDAQLRGQIGTAVPICERAGDAHQRPRVAVAPPELVVEPGGELAVAEFLLRLNQLPGRPG